MPRWNEDEALKLFNSFEWEHVAQLAHDLGWKEEEALEETLGEDDDVPTSQDAVYPLARKELADSTLLAPFKDERILVAVFERNFWLGWRCAESGGNTHDRIEAPGVSEGDSNY